MFLAQANRILLTLTLALTVLTALSISSRSFADKMEDTTHSYLINKLEIVVQSLDVNNYSKYPSMLRLADLYAERARLSEMQSNLDSQQESVCHSCPPAKSDRRRAIELYKSAFPHAKQEIKGFVLFQMAHLYLLNGEEKSAEKLYNDIVKHKNKYEKEIVGLSYTGLGEIEYKREKFKSASSYFLKALRIKETPRKGQILYRLAWCEFNSNKTKAAQNRLLHILTHRELLTTKTQDGKVTIDKAFHEEISRDYAGMLARSRIRKSDIDRVYKLSPDSQKIENVKYLAQELDRLGKQKTALLAWGYVNLHQEKTSEGTLEGHIRMAQAYYDLGNNKKSAAKIQEAAQTWKNEGCKEKDLCENLKRRLKKIITDWDKATKKIKDSHLLTAYTAYTDTFTDDIEMAYWGALVAERLGQHILAQKLYAQASQAAAKDSNGNSKLLEASLLGEIEAAEKSNSFDAKRAAYQNYLDKNPDGAKAAEVKYQMAHLDYDQSKYDQAADAFRALALNNKTPKAIAIQSADLALDSLAILKNDKKIESWTEDFAKAHPQKSQEYSKIGRQASQNIAAHSSPRDGLEKLVAIPLVGVKKEDRIKILKDRIALAEKIKDLQEVENSSHLLLKTRGISATDKEFAFSRLLWVAELKMDFSKAYSLAKKLDLKELSPLEKELKLAWLSDLAGRRNIQHYKKAIQLTRSKRQERQLMALLVRTHSRHLFSTYESDLKKDRKLYGELALEDLATTKNYKVAQKRLRYTRGQGRKNLSHYLRLHSWDDDFRSLKRHRLSQKNLSRSLQQRMSLLKKAERASAKALASHDWTLQVLHLDFLSDQYVRLHRDIMKLPIPRGLSRAQRKQYREELSKQSEPFKNKSEEYRQAYSKLWNTNIPDSMVSDYEQTPAPLRSLFALEFSILEKVAPRSWAKELRSARLKPHKGVAYSDIKNAREDVRQHPFNISYLEKLRNLESENGRYVMVAYLEARKAELAKGDR